MAKLYTESSTGRKYVIVERGDTLSEIAEDYGNGKTAKQIAQMADNKISNVDLIYVGQKIYLTESSSSSSSSSSSTTSNKATIDHLGLQANSDTVIFATWSWKREKTKEFQIIWKYATGDGVGFIGTETTVSFEKGTQDIYHATWSGYPENATKVMFWVKPVSETKKDSETSYWTASWSSKEYKLNQNPPVTPAVPSISIDNYKATVRVDGVDSKTKKIEFYTVKNDKTKYAAGCKTVSVSTGTAAYTFDVAAGNDYKVRCRAINNNGESDWTEYSGNDSSGPSTPACILTIKALSESSVQIDWANVSNAETYEVQYTTKKMYFDSNSSEVQTATVDATAAGHAEITGLTSGEEYFFRVRAAIGEDKSGWTAIKSIIIGEAPGVPTTWSSTTTAVIGEDVTLFWIHNAKDNSNQTVADLEVYVNDTLIDIPLIKNSADDDPEEITNSYTLSTSSFAVDSKIKWRVRTKGIIDEYSEWSIQRTIDVYEQPSFEEFEVTDYTGATLETLTSFPIYVSALASPNTDANHPIGYHLSIVSNAIYETVDDTGRAETINKGQEVYSRFFDTSEELIVELDAGNIDLNDGISYTMYCTVSMNSGLTADVSSVFTVSWTDPEYLPNAEIIFDSESIVTHLRPYCERGTLYYYKVEYSDGVYTVSDTSYSSIYHDEIIAGAVTTTGEQVCLGTTSNNEPVYYCEVVETTAITDVWLSVYRREFDGSFTEIAKDIDGSLNTFITDPHPALDYARYRIVAKDKDTGGISFYDVPGYPIGGKAIIIQWDEEWSDFETTTDDPLDQPPWSGSLLKLPYNIKVTNKNALDVTLSEYIGRKRPVTYYGTQLGENASWSTTIPKDDKETLYALRRLAIYPGDVYVREPSGSGYWATISVSFNVEYLATTIPVTLNVTSVEGGM